jgi:hypothetical protein
MAIIMTIKTLALALALGALYITAFQAFPQNGRGSGHAGFHGGGFKGGRGFHGQGFHGGHFGHRAHRRSHFGWVYGYSAPAYDYSAPPAVNVD